MKKISSLVLPLAALLFTASCTDNNYDLSDIDTNSRFNVSGLTIPVNMDPVKLDLMLDISDDSDIKTDAEGNYYFTKSGDFNSDPVNVSKIILAKPNVDFNGSVSVNISLDQTTRQKLEEYAKDLTIGDVLNNPTIMALIGIKADDKILDIEFNSNKTTSEINLTANNIDKNVKSIEALGVDATKLAITVKINGLQKVLEPFSINNLKLVMPKGFDVTTKEGTTYDPAAGTLVPNGGTFGLDQNYVADLSLTVKGINYAQLAEGAKVFDADKHTFTYKKSCSASGSATLKISDLKSSAKVSDILALEQPNAVSYECKIGFDRDLAISSFNGSITYSMDDIKVDPVKINNIPDILKENGTNIDLKNPQIYLTINNNLSEYGIGVNSALEIKGNNSVTAPLNVNTTPETKIVMSPLNENLYHNDFTHEEVKGLSTIVGSNDGQTFPNELNIRVIKPEVPETQLKKTFKLGENLAGVEGKWEFYTRLALTDKTKIMYTKEWDDWGKEDLDGLTVNAATINVTLQKDVKLDAESVEFVLMGGKGELKGTTALTGAEAQDITIKLAGTPVSQIKGGKLNVHLKGTNGDLNKTQEIKISNLKVSVDGYYDRKL